MTCNSPFQPRRGIVGFGASQPVLHFKTGGDIRHFYVASLVGTDGGAVDEPLCGVNHVWECQPAPVQGFVEHTEFEAEGKFDSIGQGAPHARLEAELARVEHRHARAIMEGVASDSKLEATGSTSIKPSPSGLDFIGREEGGIIASQFMPLVSVLQLDPLAVLSNGGGIQICAILVEQRELRILRDHLGCGHKCQ